MSKLTQHFCTVVQHGLTAYCLAPIRTTVVVVRRQDVVPHRTGVSTTLLLLLIHPDLDTHDTCQIYSEERSRKYLGTDTYQKSQISASNPWATLGVPPHVFT